MMALVLAAGALALAGAAESAPIEVGQDEIEFEPGEGACLLDPAASRIEQAVVDSQRRGNAGLNEVLGVFAPCDRLDRLRRDGEGDLGQYGILLASLVQGELKPLAGLSRAEFLSQLEEELDRGVDMEALDLEGRMEAALKEVNEAKEASGGVRFNNVSQLGVLQRSDTVLYSGLLIRLQSAGTPIEVASVSGSTLIRGYMIQYSLYAPFEGESTLRGLVADLEPIMTDAVARNDGTLAKAAAEGGTPGAPGSGGSGQFSLTLVIVSAAAAGIIALVVGFLRRSR
jgi:hypothetical protein